MILASLARNLRAGARLALFLRLRPFDFRVSAVDFAALVAFNCALWIVVAGARGGFAGEFDASALLIYLASVTLVLLAAMLVALAYRARERLLLVAVALVAADPVFELASLALPFLVGVAGSEPVLIV